MYGDGGSAGTTSLEYYFSKPELWLPWKHFFQHNPVVLGTTILHSSEGFPHSGGQSGEAGSMCLLQSLAGALLSYLL